MGSCPNVQFYLGFPARPHEIWHSLINISNILCFQNHKKYRHKINYFRENCHLYKIYSTKKGNGRFFQFIIFSLNQENNIFSIIDFGCNFNSQKLKPAGVHCNGFIKAGSTYPPLIRGIISNFQKFTLYPDICPNFCIELAGSVKVKRTSSAYTKLLYSVPIVVPLIFWFCQIATASGSIAKANRGGHHGFPWAVPLVNLNGADARPFVLTNGLASASAVMF